MTAPGTVTEAAASRDAHPPRRARLFLFISSLSALCGIGFLVFLGIWQLERRIWKIELIASVTEKLRADPVPAPLPADWPRIGPGDQYTRVQAAGTYMAGHDILVQAVTAYGAGYWLLTPLQTADGGIIFINRGFVPPQWREAIPPAAAPPSGQVSVTGLLRLGEPGGAFLRENDPVNGRWYSRDVAAIAAHERLTEGLPTRVAPYFIDAGRTPPSPKSAYEAEMASSSVAYPVPGLTVVAFHNNHLVYALTWFGLALMLAGYAVFALAGHSRRGTGNAAP